jgi:hypothetical protein
MAIFLFRGNPMADWFRRLLESFFEFREDRSYRCRYHNGRHYQDEIIVDSEVSYSAWLLHGNNIASLWKLPKYLRLELRTAGYPTLTTISRLNGILWYLRDVMGIKHSVEFRLKYNKGLGRGMYPLHAYVLINGRKFVVDRVVLSINPIRGKLTSVEVDMSREVVYVMDDPRLLKYRRIYKEIRRILNEAYELLNELYEQRDRVDRWTCNLCFDLYNRVRNKMYDLEDDALVTGYAYDEKTLYGVYVRKRSLTPLNLDELMRRLLELKRDAESMLSKIRETLAYAELLS